MIRCQKCGKTSEPRKPTHLIVTDRRERVYDNEKRGELGETIHFQTVGWEILKTARVCDVCFRLPATLIDVKHLKAMMKDIDKKYPVAETLNS